VKRLIFFTGVVGLTFSVFGQTKDSLKYQSDSIDIRYLYKINDTLSYRYYPTRRFGFVSNAFKDFYLLPTELVKKENFKGLGIIAASTAILIYYDQELVDAAQRFGRYINLSGENNVYNLTGTKDLRINVPTDLSSGLYYIGDGITEMGVCAGFYIYSSFTDDKRAAQTAAQLAEGMLAVGAWIQILKHLTGHESPQCATVSGGRWRFFPNPVDYQNNVPKYDAYPSGHLATAMMTATVVSMNYPEYKFIKPLCYTLMGLCGYQMMNNGVHWAGDYPLGIAIGYAVGRMAVNRGREEVKQPLTSIREPKASFQLHPVYMPEGATGLALQVKF